MLLAPARRTLTLPSTGVLQRMGFKWDHFVALLVRDVEGPRDLIPWLLAGWVAANVLATPLSFVVMRQVLRGWAPFAKTAGVNLGIGAAQAAFFTLTWYVVSWGDRSVDWAVLALSMLPATLIAKWGFERPLLACLAYVLVQAALSLGLVFLALFTLGEMGRLDW